MTQQFNITVNRELFVWNQSRDITNIVSFQVEKCEGLRTRFAISVSLIYVNFMDFSKKYLNAVIYL